MSLKRFTPCDDGVCPYAEEGDYVNCEWYCGAEEPQDYPTEMDADVMEELDRSERNSYEEDIKPLLELLNHMRKRENVDPNWDMAPIVFGYDGRMAITYNAYAYDTLRKAVMEVLDGIDEMYDRQFNWRKEEVK